MKKLSILAIMLVLAAGAAMAQPYPVDDVTPAGPNTISNMDSCDQTVSPAATLLLPYFEINPAAGSENYLISITNVSDTPIVAHVGVWSEWSYPVLDFNIYLTGYDVETLSLYDLLINGDIPPTGLPHDLSPNGIRSWDAYNYDPITGLPTTPTVQGRYLWTDCGYDQSGGGIPSSLLTQIQRGLTGQTYTAGAANCRISWAHTNLIGYITIDTVGTCSQSLPYSASYFGTELTYDNQLIGDYIRIDYAGGFSGASPLVHIRAVPPGAYWLGAPITYLPNTFYNRYQAVLPGLDRRVPTPSLWAARYIEDGGIGMATDLVIWREGYTGSGVTCPTTAGVPKISWNASMGFIEVVKFDEHENPTTSGTCPISPCEGVDGFPETEAVASDDDRFPSDPNPIGGPDDDGGWMYLNLDNWWWPWASNNWVVVRMTAAGLFAVDFDAAWLGNGCTPYYYFQGYGALPVATVTGRAGEPKIGPVYGYDPDDTLWP